MKEKGFEITVSRALFGMYPDSNSDLFRAPDSFIETLFRLLIVSTMRLYIVALFSIGLYLTAGKCNSNGRDTLPSAINNNSMIHCRRNSDS